MKLRNKKGFTIIELVIVIAVIGILTAVLVPTFINLTNKANEAADQSLVKNLNTVLATAEADVEKGYKKPGNPTDMFDILDKEGYKGETLIKNQKSGKTILYKLSTNRFEFENGNQSGSDYWEFKKDNAATGEKGYSIFLFDEYDSTNPVTVSSGLDVGTNIEATNITYKNTGTAKESTVRTNGGTLTVNAPADIVNHYGEGLVLDVQAVRGSSYHEFGYFPKAKIAQGRIVVEEKGEIPSFEVTAVPTESNPIKIETSKDITVSASQEVVAELGENKLENVNVKVTNKDAQVVVDEKMDKANVQAEGKTESELISITKVSNLSELHAALDDVKTYIMFTNDIDANAFTNIVHSVTIDGDGHSLSGDGGIRTGQTYDVLAVNWQQSNNPIDVCIKNLNATNTKTSGIARVLETRAGSLKSLKISNCNFESKSNNNDANPLCLGGNDTQSLDVKISNSTFITTASGYATLIWVPINAELTNVVLEGYAGLYYKSSSRYSHTKLSNSTINAPQVHSGATDTFGAIVFETRDISVELTDSNINVTGPGQATQTGVLFSYNWAQYYGTDVVNALVRFKGDCSINGKISSSYGDPSNLVVIEGGRYTFDPSAYVAEGHTVYTDGSFYTVL